MLYNIDMEKRKSPAKVTLTCSDCQKKYNGYKNWRTLCRPCAKERRKANNQRYWASPKGEETRIRINERRRAFLNKPRNQPPQCLDCGIVIQRVNARCRPCWVKHIRTRPKGEHPLWKGRHNSEGYILIYQPSHHRATKRGFVREHILVWEQANNKLLPDGWHVHHLNGHRGDNRPKNLVGLPSKKHYLVLRAQAKRIQELEALLNNQGQLL